VNIRQQADIIIKHTHNNKRGALIFLMVVAITILSVFAVINRDWLRELEQYGYLGVFLISAISTAALVVPGPSIVVVLAMGSVLNPLLVGLAAGLGEGLGALASYTLGCHGKTIIDNSMENNNVKHNSKYYSIYNNIEKWMKYHGGLTLFISSVLINPFFVPIGMAAAATHYPRWKYFLICWAGRTVKGIILAVIGSIGIRALLNLIGWPA